MISLEIPSDYQLTVPTGPNVETIYLGGFIRMSGAVVYVGKKLSGLGPLHLLLPAMRDPKSSELFVSVSYPPNPDKKHGKLERALELF